MTDERLEEIVEEVRSGLRAELKALEDKTEPLKDVALTNWPEITGYLRQSAELSAYYPNAARLAAMADEFDAWAAKEDRKEDDAEEANE